MHARHGALNYYGIGPISGRRIRVTVVEANVVLIVAWATLDIWQVGAVAADVDVNDAVIGIELLSLDDETIQHARRFPSRSQRDLRRRVSAHATL